MSMPNFLRSISMDSFTAGVSRLSVERASAGSKFDTRARSFAHLIAENGTAAEHRSIEATAAYQEHNEFCSRYGQPPHGGIWVPFVPAWSRVLSTANSESLIPTNLMQELIPSLTPLCAVIASGARVVPTNSNGAFAYPRMASGSSVAIVSERTQSGTDPVTGDPIYQPTQVPASDPRVDQCIVSPFTLAASTNISRRLILQNVFADKIEAMLSGDLQRLAFAELDRLVLNGSGSDGEPVGILSDPDVGAFAAGTNGAAPSLANLSDMEYELSLAYSGAPLTWFTNSAMRKKVRNTATAAGLSPLWSQDNKLLGHDTAITEHPTAAPTKGSGTALSAAVLGDFSKVVIGVWAPAFEVLFNPFAVSGAKPNLTAFLQVGFALQRKEAFMVCKDFVTT